MNASTGLAVELNNVTKYFGDLAAVRDVSLAVAKGELVTLLGPSGCGKTTILRIIAGFVRPNSGTVHIGGSIVNDLPPHRRRVGLVFQNYALFPHLTVGENVAFGLKMRRLGREAIWTRIHAVLDRVRLANRTDAYPHQLSGGQQQRVALARALVIEPEILLLDEPFGALDRELRQHMQGEMRQLQRSYAVSTLLVTHDQEEALTLSDRIVVMNSGGIEQTGTAPEIFERPQTRFVGAFMGRANLFEGRVRSLHDKTEIEFDESGIRIVLADRYEDQKRITVMIRPERVVLQPPSTPVAVLDHSSAGQLAGRVVDVSYFGVTVQTRVAIGDKAPALLIVRAAVLSDGRAPFQPGEAVRVMLPRDAIHIIS
jgi:putative spermidine/putrescine transport system ATP-binding protein